MIATRTTVSLLVAGMSLAGPALVPAGPPEKSQSMSSNVDQSTQQYASDMGTMPMMDMNAWTDHMNTLDDLTDILAQAKAAADSGDAAKAGDGIGRAQQLVSDRREKMQEGIAQRMGWMQHRLQQGMQNMQDMMGQMSRMSRMAGRKDMSARMDEMHSRMQQLHNDMMGQGMMGGGMMQQDRMHGHANDPRDR
jgi:hypothetical protein